MTIPVKNVYYLLCYAWDRYDQGSAVDLGKDDPAYVHDLLGNVLAIGVAQLLRRGLHREYVPHTEEIPGIRGKLQLQQSLSRMLLPQGRTVCAFDDLSQDVPHNRILKSTMLTLAGVPDLDRDIRHRLLDLTHRMSEVSVVELNSAAFRTIRIHRNNQLYGFLLSICRLVADQTVVDDETGEVHFNDPREDSIKMWRVFESFVRNFYRREHSEYRVSAPKLQWRQVRASSVDLARLPEMRTDVVLCSPRRTIVIDTKYYENTLQKHFGVKKVISGHLYQIFTYLENWPQGSESVRPEGLLLYPVVADAFHHRYELNGHRIRAATIDLTQHWRDIHDHMLRLVTE